MERNVLPKSHHYRRYSQTWVLVQYRQACSTSTVGASRWWTFQRTTRRCPSPCRCTSSSTWHECPHSQGQYSVSFFYDTAASWWSCCTLFTHSASTSGEPRLWWVNRVPASQRGKILLSPFFFSLGADVMSAFMCKGSDMSKCFRVHVRARQI